jgi:hypothetical protein
MPTAIVIGLVIIGLYLVVNWLYSRNRASVNFNLIYTRALRVEKDKKIAIGAAVRHLKTFLKPFDQLSENEIEAIATVFAEVENPRSAIQPVLEHARKSGNLSVLKDTQRLKLWIEQLTPAANETQR